jgi:hypothetical protein
VPQIWRMPQSLHLNNRTLLYPLLVVPYFPLDIGCFRGRDRMVVGFTTTWVISAHHQ